VKDNGKLVHIISVIWANKHVNQIKFILREKLNREMLK